MMSCLMLQRKTEVLPPTSPYSHLKAPSLSNHGNAPIVDKYADIQQVLLNTKMCRENLEHNFEAILRARQESQVYSVIEEMSRDRCVTLRVDRSTKCTASMKEMCPET